jgi:hypothetical protein
VKQQAIQKIISVTLFRDLAAAISTRRMYAESRLACDPEMVPYCMYSGENRPIAEKQRQTTNERRKAGNIF